MSAAAVTPEAAPPMATPARLGEALPIFLRHGSPRILLLALGVATAARLFVGGWSAWDLVPVLGLVAYWPIQEWLIHVWILHFKPFELGGRTIDFRVPRSHREHHRDPWNYRILFIPLHSYVYSMPLLVAVWFVVTPSTPLALTGIVTHLLLTLHYEWIHFLVHTRVKPWRGYYERIWRNHRLHHFKNEKFWFGVTMLGGDKILGTSPTASEVPASPTARRLHEHAPPS